MTNEEGIEETKEEVVVITTDAILRENLPKSFDNTMLAAWCKCPRYFYWFMRRLDLKEPPAYFAWGKAWGVGMNVWHSLQGKMPRAERFAEAYIAAENEWQKDAPIEYGDNTWNNLENLLKAYVNHYGEEEAWTMPYGQGEMGFQLPIGESSGELICYAGSIDAPILWDGYGLTIREDKSTGNYINTEGLDPAVRQYDDSTQVTGYMWAFNQLKGELPVGVLMNIVSKKKRKDIDLQFARYLVSFSQWDMDRFERDTLRIIDDIYREWDRWDWPLLGRRDPINCVGGMGRTECIYRRLCHAGAEPWELEKYYNFQEAYVWRPTWEPWKREGGNE